MCLFESQHCSLRSKQTFSWYQVLHVEGNWIGCNWLWPAGLNSKCWLCINTQIKSLFMSCVYVCTCQCVAVVISASALIAKTDPKLHFLRVCREEKKKRQRNWRKSEWRVKQRSERWMEGARVVREGERDRARGQRGQGENEGEGEDCTDVSSGINLQAWLIRCVCMCVCVCVYVCVSQAMLCYNESCSL